MSCSTTTTSTSGGCCPNYTQIPNPVASSAGGIFGGAKYICSPPQYPTKKLPVYNPQVRDTGCNGGTNCFQHDNRNCDFTKEEQWDGGRRCGDCNKSSGVNCLSDAKLTAGGAKYCPNGLNGTVTGIQYFDYAHNLICTYSAVTNPLDQLETFFETNVANQIKIDRCGPLSYSQLAASSECRTYYGANLDSELMKRIEATGNGWANDAVLRTAVNGYVAAELISNPPQPSDYSGRGKTLIRNFCTANPTDPKCGCYNAIDKGLSGCQASPTSPGCAELAALGTQFDAAPAEFKPIFQNMKNQVNAMCLSENCKTVRGSTGNSAGILLPGSVPGGDCSSNFNVCLTKLTVGQMTGGNIDSSCKQTFNLPSNAPPASGGTPAAAPSGVAITSGPSGAQGSAAGGSGPASSTTTGGNPAAPAASDLLFKDPTGYLDTKNKQMGAFAVAVVFILLLLVLLMGGGSPPPPADPMQQMLQMKMMGL